MADGVLKKGVDSGALTIRGPTVMDDHAAISRDDPARLNGFNHEGTDERTLNIRE